MSENDILTASAREQINTCLLIPKDLQGALCQIAADPVIAHMIQEFLTPRNEVIADMLPDLNDGISVANKVIDRRISQTQQQEADAILTQELHY